MDKTLNLSKRDKNFIDWIFQPEIEEQIDEDRLNDLLEYLAEVNGLTVQQYLDFVYWCEENKRTPEEAAQETRTSVELFRKSLLIKI